MLPDLLEARGQQTLPERMAVVKALIAGRGPRCDMLEVGAWTGLGAIAWRHAIEQLPERGSVTCVDPWRPYIRPWDIANSPTCADMHDWLVADKAYALFLRNTAYGDFATPILHHRATLKECAHLLPKFDLIYIDGSHYYEDVLSDILIAQTLLKPGGLLCGDDLEEQFDEVDAQQLAANLDKDYIHAGYHPGVTKAVWDVYGRVKVDNCVWRAS